MKLFIANATRQNFDLNIHVREIHKTITLMIRSGKQARFPIDLNPEQLADAVRYIEKFGARKRSEAHGKLEKFTGILYSVDRQFTEEEIRSGFEDQIDAAQDRSVRQATRAALASDLSFRDKGDKSGRSRSAKVVGIEVLQRTGERTGEQPLMDIEISEQGASSRSLPV